MNYIATESAQVKVVSNVCEVALNGMVLSDDLRNVILKESGRTYIIPLEERIKHDVSEYLLNL